MNPGLQRTEGPAVVVVYGQPFVEEEMGCRLRRVDTERRQEKRLERSAIREASWHRSATAVVVAQAAGTSEGTRGELRGGRGVTVEGTGGVEADRDPARQWSRRGCAGGHRPVLAPSIARCD